MSSSEDRGMLWWLVSEVAALNGYTTVDNGSQTDSTRYHSVVPLRQFSTSVCFL